MMLSFCILVCIALVYWVFAVWKLNKDRIEFENQEKIRRLKYLHQIASLSVVHSESKDHNIVEKW